MELVIFNCKAAYWQHRENGLTSLCVLADGQVHEINLYALDGQPTLALQRVQETEEDGCLTAYYAAERAGETVHETL